MTYGESHLLLSRVAADGSHTSQEYGRALRRGELVRLRRGVYLPSSVWFAGLPRDRHRWTAAAVALQLEQPLFCRETALALHGLPLLSHPQQVHIRSRSRARARITSQPRLTAQLTPVEFVRRAQQRGLLSDVRADSPGFQGFATQGCPPTTLSSGDLPLTVELPSPIAVDAVAPPPLQVEELTFALVDTVHRLPWADRVVLLEAARRGGPARNPLSDEDLRCAAGQGRLSERARRRWSSALEFSTPLAESPGESLSRVRIAELGFLLPELQVVLDAEGRSVRVDLLWREAGVVGEFDGWSKYALGNDGVDEAFRQEKRREDALRRTGLTVLRWHWEDLFQPDRLARLLEGAQIPRRRSA